MAITQKEIIKQTEEWLDERYLITQMTAAGPQDRTYYDGALKAVEYLGYEWKRNEEGKHTLIKC